MRNFIALEEKGSVREFIANDLSNAGLRIDTNKHRNIIINQPSPHITNNPKHQQQQQHGSRVFNVPLHQMDSISVKVDNLISISFSTNIKHFFLLQIGSN
jgi:hypothetical protein